MEPQDWAIVLSSAGNMHLMPAENVWANDKVLHTFPEEMTRDVAKEEYRAWLLEDPKVRAYQDLL